MHAQTRRKVLLIETDVVRITLAQQAVAQHQASVELVTLADAEAMQAWLSRFAHNDARPPDLLLINLRLPKLAGWAMLRKVRLQAQLSTLPIVVYSAQYTQQEVQMSYLIGANSFVAKPQTVAQFAELFAAQFSLWFKPVHPSEIPAA